MNHRLNQIMDGLENRDVLNETAEHIENKADHYLEKTYEWKEEIINMEEKKLYFFLCQLFWLFFLPL